MSLPLSHEQRPAFYALHPGGWRDYWTLLHPPYTIWHLSYVVIGAAAAPAIDGGRLAASLLAFFLAVGLATHALDELNGGPLRTQIPRPTLAIIAAAGLVGAIALGVLGAVEISWWLLAFVAFGAFIATAYSLEMWGGRFHSDIWFAVAWGAFPALTGYFTQAASVEWPAVLVALACFSLSLAQRRLSKAVRQIRRESVLIEGRIVLEDGREVSIDGQMLRAAPELALQALAVAMALLAGGLAGARLV